MGAQQDAVCSYQSGFTWQSDEKDYAKSLALREFHCTGKSANLPERGKGLAILGLAGPGDALGT